MCGVSLCCGAHQLNGIDVWGTLVLWSTSAQWDGCVTLVLWNTTAQWCGVHLCCGAHQLNGIDVWVPLCCRAHQLSGTDVWGTLVLWSTPAQWDRYVGYPCVVEHISSMG